MGEVAKFLFMPVGLGGMGVDFTKDRPLETWTGPKEETAPVYDADAEKKKAEEASSAKYRKAAAAQTQTVNTSALGNTGNVNTGKTVLGG